MASTNKTIHYELSQYVGTDKPTYLTDYNNDMSAIDTGIYNAQTKADSAYTAAGVADGKAGDAQTTANSALTNAGTANTNIGTMANLTTTEKSSLVGAINELDSDIKKFDLNSTTTYGKDDLTPNDNNTIISAEIKLATNSDGSIFKLYGQYYSNATANSGYATATISTSLRPSSEYTINSAGIFVWNDSGYWSIGTAELTVKTNGNIDINYYIPSTGGYRIVLMPCLYFNKSFGDTPTPTP